MLPRVIIAGAFALASATGLVIAQAPNITPAGDPSIRSDTVYRLAVDSAAYPEQASVILLDDGVIRLESDGRSSRTFRQVTQILRDGAVSYFQERELSYDADRDSLTINWMRVVKPDGTIISAQPTQTQVSDVPAEMVDPVYMHRKVLRASLSGVAPGTLVDISYTIEERLPARPGDFFASWYVSSRTLVRRSRFLVDVPQNMELQISEHHLSFAHTQTVVGQRKVFVWATQDVPWNKSEMYAPSGDANDLYMWFSIAAPASWSDVGHWYAGLAHDRLVTDSALRDTVQRVLTQAHPTTRDDSMHAIERWVAQDIRYVSISLGEGGYQPRFPGKVVSTGFGDCKDKATLLIDALRVIGIDAYPVLLDAGGEPERTLPTIQAFDHEITAIKQPGKPGYEFVDPTSEFSRYGTLPYTDEGEFALVVHPDGSTEEITTPVDNPTENRVENHLTGTLSDSGRFSGHGDFKVTGLLELGLRALMRDRMDSTRRAAFLRTVANAVFPNAKGDSLVTFDGRDPAAPAEVSFAITGGQATQRSGDTDILPWHTGADHWSQLADELQANMPRHMPIDATEVAGPSTTNDETRIMLPDGWHARLPTNVVATSVFGSYAATYSQEGRTLVMKRTISGTTGVYPKDRIVDLIAWYRAMAKDNVPFIVIDHGSPPKQ